MVNEELVQEVEIGNQFQEVSETSHEELRGGVGLESQSPEESAAAYDTELGQDVEIENKSLETSTTGSNVEVIPSPLIFFSLLD